MDTGAEIDIKEQVPAEKIRQEKETWQRKKKEKTLREQAEYLNVIATPQGEKLIAMVVDKLERRINYLIGQDAEATAYKKILDDLKHKENLAKKAIGQLYDLRIES